MSLPLVILMGVGLTVVGECALPAGQSEESPARLSVIHQHYVTVIEDWMHIPTACHDDIPGTDIQKAGCDQFWKAALSGAALALIPFVLMVVGFWWIRGSQAWFYRKARARIEQRKGAVNVLLCEGGEQKASGDFFSWLYCLRPVCVSLVGMPGSESHKVKFTVYLSPDTPSLSGGETLKVYDLGVLFGKSRRIAVYNDTPRYKAAS